SGLLLATTSALAQIGSGWTQKTFSERFEYETNSTLFTISPPPAVFNDNSLHYDTNVTAAGTETFRLLKSTSNRAEIRGNDDYSSGSRQFEADVIFYAPTTDECIHQVFNGTTAPFLLLRAETNNNGSLKIALHTGGSATFGSNLNGVWFHLNSINSLSDGN